MSSSQQQLAAYHGNVKTQEELDKLIDDLGGEEAYAQQVAANVESYKNIKREISEENKEALQNEKYFVRTSSRLVDSLFNRRKMPLDLNLLDESEDDVLAVALGRSNYKKHLQRFNVSFE